MIAVGGKDDSVPLRLQNGETTYSNCDTMRTIALVEGGRKERLSQSGGQADRGR